MTNQAGSNKLNNIHPECQKIVGEVLGKHAEDVRERAQALQDAKPDITAPDGEITDAVLESAKLAGEMSAVDAIKKAMGLT